MLLVASKRVADEVVDQVGDRHAATFSDVVQHVPVEVAERARQAAREVHADTLVTVGGGSAVGLAKAVALDLDLPTRPSDPAQVTGPSGMNALAHCVEAFYGPGANPISAALATEGIRALAAGLRCSAAGWASP